MRICAISLKNKTKITKIDAQTVKLPKRHSEVVRAATKKTEIVLKKTEDTSKRAEKSIDGRSTCDFCPRNPPCRQKCFYPCKHSMCFLCLSEYYENNNTTQLYKCLKSCPICGVNQSSLDMAVFAFAARYCASFFCVCFFVFFLNVIQITTN